MRWFVRLPVPTQVGARLPDAVFFTAAFRPRLRLDSLGLIALFFSVFVFLSSNVERSVGVRCAVDIVRALNPSRCPKHVVKTEVVAGAGEFGIFLNERWKLAQQDTFPLFFICFYESSLKQNLLAHTHLHFLPVSASYKRPQR